VATSDLDDLIVGEPRHAAQRLVDGEDDAGHVAGAVVLGNRVAAARRTAVAEVLLGGVLGVGLLFGLEMDVNVERGDALGINTHVGHEDTGLRR
jgi:hypothetical protein